MKAPPCEIACVGLFALTCLKVGHAESFPLNDSAPAVMAAAHLGLPRVSFFSDFPGMGAVIPRPHNCLESLLEISGLGYRPETEYDSRSAGASGGCGTEALPASRPAGERDHVVRRAAMSHFACAPKG